MVSLSPAPVLDVRERWDGGPPAAPAALPNSFADPFKALSPREHEITAAVAAGRSNKEIARALRISPWTVSSHLRQVFAKLGVTRRIELSLLWHRCRTS